MAPIDPLALARELRVLTPKPELERLIAQLHGSTRVLSDTALEPLFSRRGVRLLGRFAFQDPPKPEHLPALRCLNNVLVRSVESRKMLPSEIGATKMVATLKVNHY